MSNKFRATFYPHDAPTPTPPVVWPHRYNWVLLGVFVAGVLFWVGVAAVVWAVTR